MMAALVVVASCRHSTKAGPASDGSASGSASKLGTPRDRVSQEKAPGKSDSTSLINELSSCEVDQLGPVLEIGTSEEAARLGYSISADSLTQSIDRSGGTFMRIYNRRLTHELWLDEPMERPRVTVRLVGAGAKRMTVRLDNSVVGTTKLAQGELLTRSFPAIEGIVEPGRHTVSLEFRGQSSDRLEPSAELDWIHLGQTLDGDAIPTVPTRRTLVADQNIGGVPLRSVVLRAPSSIRCPLLLTTGAHLRVSLGFWGSGTGLGEVRVIEDGQAPVTLRQQKAQGGNGARWTPIDLDLSTYANRIVALEFRALRASQGGRVAFGEPTIVRSEVLPTPDLGHPRVVVVVVAAGLSRRKIPPWGPIGTFTALGHLQRDAVAFQNYQASSTVPAAVLATLLTGLSPFAHRLEDTAARLPASINTLQQSIKQASGRTALFTGVPATFAAFGFNSGWDEIQTFSPVKDQAASEPLVQATRWLQHELEQDDDTKRFVLVHVRGMHPPWDLTKEEVAALQPAEYGGPLDARRGGITLGRIRRQTLKTQRRLSDEDWLRLDSLTTSAFADQTQALDALINLLKRQNVWQSSLFIFLGDVASGEPPNVPFDPMGNLREDQLIVPLLVKFPGNIQAGRSVDTAVTTADVSRTVYDAFGLDLPVGINAADLAHIAAGRGPLAARPLLATLGNRYASRLANWLLFGEIGKEPSLCELYVDPACTTNRFSDRPWTAMASWQWTRNELLRMKSFGAPAAREPASIDADTAAALTVWGDVD
jgi:arylsulfatase A-like enzyme